MAENRRVRLEDDLEKYLASQAERVLGKSPEELTPADYSTLTNRCLYEHRQVTGLTHRIPLGRLVDWLLTLPPSGRNLSLIQQGRGGEPVIAPAEDFSFDAELGDLYEQEAA